MWLCLEVDTEEIEIWTEIDKLLSNNLGLTHIIWGVDDKEKSLPCKLPGNLFHGKTSSCSEKQLVKSVMEVLKPMGLSYRIIAMKNSWSHEEIKAPKSSVSEIVKEEDISSREV